MEPSADLILANRAYLDHDSPPGGNAPSRAGNGGLLTAVRPVIAPWDGHTGTTWIGAGSGDFDREWADERGFELIPTDQGKLRHRRLFFDEATWRAHYGAVANSFFWPLLHLVREPLPDVTSYYPRPETPAASEWDAYRRVNEQFAAAVLEEPGSGRSCWVHDYQLALVPGLLRDGGFKGPVGFFLHTPFPDINVVSRYLDATERVMLGSFIGGILGADLVGLQSKHDVQRFIHAAQQLCGAAVVDGGVLVFGRTVKVDAYPVGMDSDELLTVAREAPTPTRLAEFQRDGLPLVVGLERSDYTKGIPERLRAVARAMREGARFAYLGIAAPTRVGVPAYERLRETIEPLAAAAGEAARAAGLPFRHAHEVIDWSEVVALQREADVVFTSSLADGMNLVPMQAAVAQSLRPRGERAVLITGRDAGVASAFTGFEQDGLVPVNPLDDDAMVWTLKNALAGKPGRVSDRLVAEVRRHDALAWATRFLTDLERAC
jgi:trehalose 6-phosphate synthase